ncbi:A24 family peptidase [Desulfogranum japonicum]|uniref:A24 family peptidase n=1 Tax=Desulfogranum japonicum TaxID=231447 RepID=UPI0003FCA11F|nr:prepilin peptidase [Desulfogranum japonicum]
MAITLAVIACAVITDVWKGKIYNWLTLPALVMGLGLAGIQQGWTGLGLSFLGLLIGGGLPLIPFCLGALGGGDVKLFAAIGALMGPAFICETLLASVLAGGVISFVVILKRSKIKPTLTWYWGCITAVVTFLLFRGTGLVLPKGPDAGTTPYAISICVGVICAYNYDILDWLIIV